MPKIQTYTAKDEKLTPSAEGVAAWETAGRRLGPAYNEAGHLIDQSMEVQVKAAERQQKALGEVEQSQDKATAIQDQLNKAWDSQIKDLYDIGAAKGTGNRGQQGAGGRTGGFDTGFREGSGGGGRTPRDQLQGYGAATEINTGASMAHKGIQGMSLGQYKQEQNDLYNSIAAGGEATPAQLNWYMNKFATNQAAVDKTNAAMVAENGGDAANQWYNGLQKDQALTQPDFFTGEPTNAAGVNVGMQQVLDQNAPDAPTPAPPTWGSGWFGTGNDGGPSAAAVQGTPDMSAGF